MDVLDMWKELKELWNPPAGKMSVIAVPALSYLMIDGVGNPEASPAFKEAVQAMYTSAYTMKFSAKFAGIANWRVMPLEGLWWFPSGKSFGEAVGEEINWRLLIMQPPIVTAAMLEQAKAEAVRKKKDVPALERVRLETWEEGLCVQTMYVGPYDAESAAITVLHSWIATNGYRMRGVHHELYISDPNRTKPERLRTILRQPVERL